MRRLHIAYLAAFVVLASGRAPAQTLDERHGPLLQKNQAVIELDYGQFTFENLVLSVAGSYTYFQWPYHSFVPHVGFGISKRVQLTFSGAYLPPVWRPETSTLGSRLLLVSGEAELVARPTSAVELVVAYLNGRSREDVTATYGIGTRSDNRERTQRLQVRGVWLPRPDAASRLLRADLDGLTGPLLRRRRASMTWNALWRRYGATSSDYSPASSGALLNETRSTDTRLGGGGSLGVTDELQVAGDGYWQPPFTVRDFMESTRQGTLLRLRDESVRFTSAYGWRVDARWRPLQRLELFGGTRREQQSARDAVDDGRDNAFRQIGVDTGATWLSRTPTGGSPWQADLRGLYRPLLERHQLRLDGTVYLRKVDDDLGWIDWHAHSTTWRVRGTVGLWSWLQASLYTGGYVVGGDAVEKGTSLGGELRYRPTRRLEAYGRFDYRPHTALDRYPAFTLDVASRFRSYRDFTETTYLDTLSAHVGLRLVF